jgi:serine/threonine protein kinase
VCPKCLLRTAIETGGSRALAPLLPRLRYFGDYELLEEIARGGMGVIYRAKQMSLDRIVAVKMMRPGFLSTEAEILRFRAEARTAASLHHSNIVAIHEVGEFEGLHYFSMDFVEGPSLAELVRERPLSSEEAARHVQILAETVQYAHSRGILHRDLKPSNVLLDGSGRPRITDFGLARPLDGESGMTVTGTIVGTPAYMPPEQAAADHQRLGPASDVYSLGAILYELVTGLPPFRGKNQLEIVRQVMEQAPLPPSQLNPGADRDLEAVCLRCLAKDPAQRYQTAAELAADLKRVQHHEVSQARALLGPQNRRRFGKYAWALLAVTLAILALLMIRSEPRARHDGVPASPSNPAAIAVPSATVPPAAAAPLPTPAKLTVGQSVVRSSVQFLNRQSAAGYSQPFRYTNPRGADHIVLAEISFHSDGRDCVILAEPQTGRVSLQYQADRGPQLRVSGDAGSLNVLENAVCSIDLASVSFKREGKVLEIAMPMKFKPAGTAEQLPQGR